MRRNKKRKTILVMLLLILFSLISIGYATLTANVSTSGGATVKAIRWTAYFDNINETPGSVTANSAPTTNGIRTTELNWTVSMDTPGQFYEFTVDVVNIGRRDAMVESLVDTTLVAPQSNYFNYTVTYIDDIPIEQYDKLPANSTDTLKIRIEFRTDIAPENLPETAQEISLTYPSNYVEADSNAKARDKSISVAIIKVDGTAVGNNNVTVYEGYTSDISIDNSEGMENITYSSSDTSVATVNSSGTITGVGCGTATITLTGAKSGKTKTFTVEVKKPIGSPVNYSTTLNGQTLSNWKVFYVDGDYTYIILDDYLPNAAVSNDVRTTYNLANGNGTYSIKSTTNRTDLINAMTTTSNWAELINNGEMNGTALSSAVKSDANVIAKGAPDLELWVNSWNASYPADTLYTKYENPVTGQTFDGWYVGDSANPTTTYISVSSKAGYNNTLYYPHQVAEASCWGYWLASPSARGDNSVMRVSYGGYVRYDGYDNSGYAFRPVVRLPSSIVNQ